MAALLIKRGIWIGIGLLAIALIIAAALPYVAVNRINATALSLELSEITGRRLVYDGEPVFDAFPFLIAEINDFSLHNPGYASNNFPALRAENARFSLSVLAALRGKIQITGIEFDRPVFRARAEDGRWQLPYGDQARLAKLIGNLSASQPQTQYTDTLNAVRDNSFGAITINDGTIVLDRAATDLISSINGSLLWASGSDSGHLRAKALWRGEQTGLEITTDDVAMLMAGVDTGISAVFESKPLETRFTGMARLQPSPYIEGTVFTKASSVSKVIEWQKLTTPFEFAEFGLTLAGALKGEADKWQLEDSQLQWGTNKGTGGLIFQPGMTPPMLSGTLDFETLDLALLTRLFAQSPNAKLANAPAIGADLRISANAASFGALELSKVAASLQISKETNALDIHDAAAFGGTLQMALKSQNNPAPKTELRILANDIETKALTALGGPLAQLPQARGSLSAILSGANIASPAFFETAAGTVKLRFGEGTLPGMNANQMVRALRKGGFFAMKAEAPSVLSFKEINAEAMLAQGTLQFNPLRIGLDKAEMTLTGAYSVKNQSIALTGSLDLEAGHPEAPNGAESIAVFFGGNRDAPLMTGLQ